MLKIRVLTAAVLGPLFILGVFYLPAPYFALLVGVVVLMGAWEWARLSGYTGNRPAVATVILAALLMLAAYRFREATSEQVFILACVAWLAVSTVLFLHRHKGLVNWPRPVRWLSGFWVLVPAWLALVVLQETDPGSALLLLLLVWSADVGAYFVGRQWGHRKLASAISPGKSLEGVCGGAGLGLIVAAGFGAFWGFKALDWLGLVVWSAAVVLVSVFGDLFESNWKRLVKMKDSSGLLPGHGGVLDRIDSVTAAAPFFALGWSWWFASAPA